MPRLSLIAALLGLSLLTAPFSSAAAPAAPPPLEIFVSVLPLKYFAERIGGERVAVQVMVGPGRSPATYEPTPRQMAELSRSRLYYRVGVPFESVWMARIAALNPALEIVDLRDGLALRRLEAHDHAHEGGHHHHHHHGQKEADELDPHLWTAPLLVEQMAARIRDTLSAADPAEAPRYQANYSSFAADLEKLDQDIRQRLGPLTARRFLVFHPAWGYFADAYGLEQVAIESQGKEPGPRGLARLIAQARQEGISVIFVQPQFSRSTAAVVADAIEGRVAAVDPLAEDYLNNLRQVVEVFAEALEPAP